jgi:phosphoenolpyruvate carboxykinase (ATP)
MTDEAFTPQVGLDSHGLTNLGRVYWTPNSSALYEEAVKRGEGCIAHLGPLVVRTGSYTGRSPHDKFLVEEPSSREKIWWGQENRPFPEAGFEILFRRLQAYLQGRDVFVQDCYAGADPEFRLPVRVICEKAWHSLFARNMFRQISDAEARQRHQPAFTVLDAPDFKAIPEVDGTNSEAFIIVNFGRKLVLIGGTSYAGEIKKSIFTVLNYLLPQRQVMTMHCSANAGPGGEVAIFFGLSGTGKTTLSADPERSLIGDDEHGWSDRGVFNFEGGCYAKAIRLSAEAEPEIYQTTRRFGTILENVYLDPVTRWLDLDDASLTENTRAGYPLTHIPDFVPTGMGEHPRHLIMLTCDAFGIMPPIARLTPEQARYHFLSGYTAKVAGTERGAGSAPKATFSACFGAPFMALPPTVYSGLLGEKITRHEVRCWLVNTGWTGGPVGTGSRMKIAHSRAMVKAALAGQLDAAACEREPVFGLEVPRECPGVPPEVLNPRGTWADPSAYDAKAAELVGLFRHNFRPFEDEVPPEVAGAGPATG